MSKGVNTAAAEENSPLKKRAGMSPLSLIHIYQVSEIKDGLVMDYVLPPEHFGFERASVEDIRGGTAVENAQITRDILGLSLIHILPRISPVVTAARSMRCVKLVR